MNQYFLESIVQQQKMGMIVLVVEQSGQKQWCGMEGA